MDTLQECGDAQGKGPVQETTKGKLMLTVTELINTLRSANGELKVIVADTQESTPRAVEGCALSSLDTESGPLPVVAIFTSTIQEVTEDDDTGQETKTE